MKENISLVNIAKDGILQKSVRCRPSSDPRYANCDICQKLGDLQINVRYTICKYEIRGNGGVGFNLGLKVLQSKIRPVIPKIYKSLV